METLGNQLSLEEHLLQKNPALRAWLIPENGLWAGFNSFFSLFLFVFWTIHLEYDLVTWVLLVDLYSVGILIAIRKSSYRSMIQQSNDNQQITFIRSGIAWKRITDALIGLAIISSIFVFMFSNALPTYPEFVFIIYKPTLIIQAFIFPMIPALSNIKSLSILKSKIHIAYDGEKIINVNLDLHPLDYQKADEILSTQ